MWPRLITKIRTPYKNKFPGTLPLQTVHQAMPSEGGINLPGFIHVFDDYRNMVNNGILSTDSKVVRKVPSAMTTSPFWY